MDSLGLLTRRSPLSPVRIVGDGVSVTSDSAKERDTRCYEVRIRAAAEGLFCQIWHLVLPRAHLFLNAARDYGSHHSQGLRRAGDQRRTGAAISWHGTRQQYVGRLHRIHHGKKVVRVFDYVDAQVPMLGRMYDKRLKGYRAIGSEMASDAQHIVESVDTGSNIG
jgi:hypothetical protein